jgi:hypothetical protein
MKEMLRVRVTVSYSSVDDDGVCITKIEVDYNVVRQERDSRKTAGEIEKKMMTNMIKKRWFS